MGCGCCGNRLNRAGFRAARFRPRSGPTKIVSKAQKEALEAEPKIETVPEVTKPEEVKPEEPK